MAYYAKEHASRLFGSSSALEGIFQLCHVCLGLIFFNDENMQKAAADQTTKSRKRSERPNYLQRATATVIVILFTKTVRFLPLNGSRFANTLNKTINGISEP